jgi:hypothetical protein
MRGVRDHERGFTLVETHRLPELDKCTTPLFDPLVYDPVTGNVSCSTPGHHQ